MNLEFSLLMPCLNEAWTMGTCVAKAQRFIAAHDISGEVIVADNALSAEPVKPGAEIG